ncbi:50S ribosome-binding GTPase [Popillia japonica]|uniref:50S ribosome-binding GTPase n=2 Tax=Popillia japonica TaxID=7064 RepID=A0AAW1M0M4_POPJA
MGILEKISEIEKEISRTQKNKATEYHLGLLKAKLAKYRSQLLEPSKKSEKGLGLLKAKLAKYRSQLLEPSKKSEKGSQLLEPSKKSEKGEGFDVLKSGDARVALIGFPSVGKSTLLSTLTKTESEAASQRKRETGYSCCRQVIAVARTADLVLMMLDATKQDVQRQLLERELESVGIRLNKAKPNIYFKVKKGGGISFNSTCTLTKIDEKMVQMILHEYKLFNAEVLFREDCTADELIDVICANRVYLPCLYVYNKIDQISIEEVDRIARQSYSVVVSCNMKLNLDYLLETLWEYLRLIRVYTKKPGQPPDFADGLILRKGVTVEHVCHAIHRSLAQAFKYALVWGTSTKYSPQRVGANHIMHDEDVIQVVKK